MLVALTLGVTIGTAVAAPLTLPTSGPLHATGLVVMWLGLALCVRPPSVQVASE